MISRTKLHHLVTRLKQSIHPLFFHTILKSGQVNFVVNMCQMWVLSFLKAWGISQVEKARRLLYLLPDDRRLKMLCERWLRSPTMLIALRVRWVWFGRHPGVSGVGQH